MPGQAGRHYRAVNPLHPLLFPSVPMRSGLPGNKFRKLRICPVSRRDRPKQPIILLKLPIPPRIELSPRIRTARQGSSQESPECPRYCV